MSAYFVICVINYTELTFYEETSFERTIKRKKEKRNKNRKVTKGSKTREIMRAF